MTLRILYRAARADRLVCCVLAFLPRWGGYKMVGDTTGTTMSGRSRSSTHVFFFFLLPRSRTYRLSTIARTVCFAERSLTFFSEVRLHAGSKRGSSNRRIRPQDRSWSLCFFIFTSFTFGCDRFVVYIIGSCF